MRLLILGAGQVGRTLTEALAEECQITVVDADSNLLSMLSSRFDIATETGQASSPTVLQKAGCAEADMLVAVTDSDEVNMLACQIAHSLFKVKTKIARVRNEDYYFQNNGLFNDTVVPVDLLINPSRQVTYHLETLMKYPSALQVLDLANKHVKLIIVRATERGELVGKKLNEIRKHIPHAHTRVAAIYRNGKALFPSGDTKIEPYDEVFIISNKNDIQFVISEMRNLDNSNRHIFIAGGGHIGLSLATRLEKNHKVKVFEHNTARCSTLSHFLQNSIIINCDVADHNVLLDENIKECDTFCSLTNVDEVNLVSGILAKQLGAHRSLSLLNNIYYHEMIRKQNINIDIPLSPQQITTSHLLSYIRGRDVVKAHSLHQGSAEVIEAVVHSGAMVEGYDLREMPLPSGTALGALIRDNNVLIKHKSIKVQKDDHIIFFVMDKKNIKILQKLFTVK